MALGREQVSSFNDVDEDDDDDVVDDDNNDDDDDIQIMLNSHFTILLGEIDTTGNRHVVYFLDHICTYRHRHVEKR